MNDDREIMDPSLVPPDLPDDLRASYKPRSVFPASSSVSDSASALREKLDSQQLALWRTAYGDGHDTGSRAGDPPAEQKPGERPAVILHRMVGKGGFGEVWAATQTSLGRVIAVKRMKEDMFADTVVSDSTARQVELSFRQEALTAANLDHPNIVPLHDLGRDEKGRAMLSMKLVRGRPWEEIIDEDRPALDPIAFLGKHVPILIQVTQAVAFAHSRGIVHRDLKPGQVMVGDFGEVLLMDWGLAVVYDEEKARIDGSTFLESGIAPTKEVATNPAGTIVYMAPEQTDKTAERIAPWTDVFLLGGTLYTLLTGTTPYRASGNVAAFFKAMRGEVEAPSRRTPKAFIPDELENLCRWSMEPSIQKRLCCARTFIRELEAYLTGATRRREAQQLLDQAEELYAAAVSYESFGRALLTVERAAKLWPENDQIFGLQQRLVTGFAEMALRNEDLILARTQAQRIADTATRDRISLLVERKEGEVADAERKKVFFRRLSAFSILVMIISLGAHYAFVLTAREELEQAISTLRGKNIELMEKEHTLGRTNQELKDVSEAAVAARQRAEDLVSFLALDLSTDIARMGRANLLERVAAPLITFYGSQGGQIAEDAESQRNRASALLLEAMLDRLAGRSNAATSKLAEALDRTVQIIHSEPDEHDLVDLLARILIESALVQETLGDADAAADFSSRAVEALTALLAVTPDDPRRELELAGAYLLQGRTLSLGGKQSAASIPFDNAQQIFTRQLAALGAIAPEQRNMASLQLLLMAETGMARLQIARSLSDWELGAGQEGLGRLERAVSLLQAAQSREPWNMAVRDDLTEANLYRSLILYELGDYVSAQYQLDMTLMAARSVVQLDGDTVQRRVESSYVQVLRGLVAHRLGNKDSAREFTLAGVEETRSFPGGDAETEALRIARGVTLSVHALILEEGSEEFNAALTEALGLFREHVRNLESVPSYVANWYAVAALKAGDPEARRLLETLAERGVRRREVYEAARSRGLVEESSDFTLRLKP